MYGKYWSVFLLAGLALAALIDRRRAAYFRSPAPWITCAVGALALAPHIWWLVQNHFAPFAYAREAHHAAPVLDVARGASGYIGGSIAYVAVPLIAIALAARPNVRTLRDTAWPREDDRRLAAAAFWAPLLLPVLGAFAGRTEITSLWSMPAWSLLPVLLLSSPRVTIATADIERALGCALVFPFILVALSPVIAYFTAHAAKAAQTQQALLARQVEHEWHTLTPKPLRFVGGDGDSAFGVVTYAADRPHALTGLPERPADVLKRDGMAFVCASDDANCVARAKVLAQAEPKSRTVESTIVRAEFGRIGEPQRYTIVLVPPQ